MLRNVLKRSPRSGRAFAIVFTAVALASLSIAGSASAWSMYEKFKNCPTANPEVKYCAYGKTENTSYLKAGLKTVLLKRALILQGGMTQLNFNETPETWFNPENGTPVLKPVPQNVEGGLQSVVEESMLSGKVLEEYKKAVKEGHTKVTATIETASNPSVYFNFYHLGTEKGTAIGLPLKVHFKGAIMGEHCYAGSDEAPINVELTDGTTSPPPPTEPMTGKFGHLGEPVFNVKKLTENSLVNNTFAAPAIEGCGLEPADYEMLDAAINTRVGLPAPEGENETRINGTLFLAVAETVVEKGF